MTDAANTVKRNKGEFVGERMVSVRLSKQQAQAFLSFLDAKAAGLPVPTSEQAQLVLQSVIRQLSRQLR